MHVINKRILLLNIGCYVCCAIPNPACVKGFVYLHEVDPTILTSLRYFSNQNFIGKPVDGYKKSIVMLTKEAAEALKMVQEDVKKDGYSLVVYDAYRPQRAVDHFIRWSNNDNQQKKSHYYPRITKADIFKLGYIHKRSGHSLGNRIDLTIIKAGNKIHEIKEVKRTLLDGYTITILDDGTVDMGSSFDLFDAVSHTATNLIPDEYKKQRVYLKTVMEKHGFIHYPHEWWHFTFKNESFPTDQDGCFDFEIE